MSKHIKEDYYLTIIEGISPMTRVPATPYRVAGLGILKEADCLPKIPTPNQPPLNNTAPKPEPKPCDMFIFPESLDGYSKGDEVRFAMHHTNTSGTQDMYIITEPGNITELDDDSLIRFEKEGAMTIKFVTIFGDGQECVREVTGVIGEGREDDFQESGNVIVCPSETVEIGRVTIPSGHNKPLVIGMKFSTISGADFPDLNVKSPNGETFGYNDQYLTGSNSATDTSNTSSSKATYTGYAPSNHDEEFTFENPIAGEWIFYAQNSGGNQKSEVSFYVSEGIPFTLTYPGPSC